jgi:type II secretory pathway component PulK
VRGGSERDGYDGGDAVNIAIYEKAGTVVAGGARPRLGISNCFAGETPAQRSIGRRQRRGAILIIALGVITILTAFVLMFARSMRVEAIASANRVATAQAQAAEKAGEQYAIAMLIDQQTNDTAADFIFTLDESEFEAIPVGESPVTGYFWFVRPDYGDDSLPNYGLVSENGKLNINAASDQQADNVAQLNNLPLMTPDVATSIVEWRTAGGTGQDSSYYSSLPDPYTEKGAAYETVEELALIKGVTPEMLYGTGAAINASNTPGTSGAIGTAPTLSSDLDTDRGIYDLLTVVSKEPGTIAVGTGRNATQVKIPPGRINVNQAPQEVLACLPNVTSGDVSQMVSARQNLSDPTDTSWTSQIASLADGQLLITGKTYQYSADIVAVSANGRSFKRYRVIFDATGLSGGTTPVIIYRRDITEQGWPLAPDILTSLRQGAGLPQSAYQPPPGRTS